MVWCIAALSMIADHVGAILQGDVIAWRIVGRLSFPLFAWGVTEGMRRSRDRGEYLWRLVCLAVPSEAVHHWLFGEWGSPVMMLFTGACVLQLSEKWREGVLLVAILAGQAVWVLPVAWAYPSPVPILCALLSGVGGNWVQGVALVAVPVVKLLHDVPGPKVPRLIKYGLYPVHLIVLGTIKTG